MMVLKRQVFLCILVLHVEWHLRRDLKELLFDDHEREAAEAVWKSIVDKAPRSESAKRKRSKHKTEDG
jgi:aminoglycoside/choline kinase family phosphotransferase